MAEGWQRRLNEALTRAGWSATRLATRLAEREVRSSSYSSVWAYLNRPGVAAPPLEFLEAAADVLRVRPAWLVLGQGEPTWDEEWAREEIEEARPEDFELRLPLGEWERATLLAAWSEIARLRGSGDAGGPGLMADLEEAVETPLRILYLPRSGFPDALNDYAATVALAIRRYARALRKQEAEPVD